MSEECLSCDICNSPYPSIRPPSEIGFNTPVRKAMEAIFCGASPTLYNSREIYVLSMEKYHIGMFVYTKFDRDLTPLHSVEMPFSIAWRVGDLIMRGEGTRHKLEPIILEVPNPPLDNRPKEC